MLGARIKYNQDYATIIQENDTHVLLKFDSGTQFCILKSSIDRKDIFDEKIC